MITNTLHPIMAQAIAPFMPTAKARFQATYCSQCGNEFGPANQGYSRCSDHSHRQLSSTLYLMATAIKTNGALSDKCIRSVVDQLQELANEVDQDEANQQAEQT